MILLNLDFETRSKIDLKSVGAYRYAVDNSTSILCFAWHDESQPEDKIETWKIGDELPSFCFDKSTKIKAHNSFFEYCIWNFVLTKMGAVRLPIENFECTAAKAAYHTYPRELGQCGKAMGLKVLKNEEGKRLMLKLSKPKADGSFYEYNSYEYALLLEYCKDDVRAEMEIDKNLRNLPAQEKLYFNLDQKINLRGVPIDIDGVSSALDVIAAEKERADKRIKEITAGAITSLGQRDKVLEYIAALGVHSATLQKADVDLMLKSEIPGVAREILELRQSMAKSSTSKFETLKDMLYEDERARGLLLYHGSTTGRWAGRHFQPHNLPRGTIKDVYGLIEAIKTKDSNFINAVYGNVMAALSSSIRGMICAPEGKKFYCADFSAIEARMVFWLAKCVEGLAIYNGSGKAYEEMAAAIFNCSVDDILEGSLERQLGKQAVLGCGYGMGAAKFLITCQGYGIAATEALAKLAVNTYREKFHEVKDYWYSTERAAIEAVKYRKIVENGRITWAADERFLYCKLPSGRVLHFPGPEITQKATPWGEMRDCLTLMGMNPITRKWERYHTYGGMLVENINQGQARDAMAESMLRLEASNYPVILTVHDEIISETAEDFGNLSEFENLMKMRPSWALDCPIDAKGWEGQRYKK